MPTLFNRFVLLAACILLLLANAKAQSLSWAQAINGCNTGSGSSVTAGTTDIAGNLYSIGNFCGTVDFDAGPGVNNLSSVSKQDMFIMKEDSSGKLIWVKQINGTLGGTDGCFGPTVNVDQNKNILISGFAKGSWDFDPGPAVNSLSFRGGYNSFVLKLDSAGNFIWVKSIGVQTNLWTTNIQATAAKLDENDNLWLAASMNGHTGWVDVDPGPGVNSIYLEDGTLLLEKLDSGGNFIWAGVINSGPVLGIPKTTTSLAFDSASNVIVSGNFSGYTDFDPSTASFVLQCSSASCIFIAKYDSSGKFSWAKMLGSNKLETQANAGGVNCFGNVLVTGSFGGTVDFDPGPNVNSLTANSAKNAFTLKLRNNGDFSWVRTVGKPSGTYYGGAVTTDGTGNVYSALGMSDSCDLDPGAGSFYVPSGVAVQELDSSGHFMGGAAWQGKVPNWMGLDNQNSIYVSGIFSGDSSDFDPGPGVFLLSGNSYGSGYIIKLKQDAFPNSIMGINRQAEVNVYPIPSSGLITFSSPLVIQRIQVTDLAGRIVYANEPKRAKAVIDLGGKASGVYFYEVDCGSGKQRGKLVIY